MGHLKTKLMALGVILVAIPALSSVQTPPSATSLMLKAQQQATREGKAVFVVFDASW